MYYVYVLQNGDGFLYKGITNNLKRRLKEHNNDRNIGTRGKGPWKMVHVEICKDRIEARELEKYFKSGSGREILKEIIK